jgi:ribosomal protein S18 acetylase RimI-like enzyme
VFREPDHYRGVVEDGQASRGPRAAAAEELPAAARLLVAFNAEYDDPAPPPERLAAHLATLVAGGDTAVLLTGDPAVGVAVLRFRAQTWVPEPECYLAELYIAPEHRGRGLGRGLLEAVVEHARGRGATYLDLNTTLDDVAACRLYESAGMDCHEGRGPEHPLAVYYELDL